MFVWPPSLTLSSNSVCAGIEVDPRFPKGLLDTRDFAGELDRGLAEAFLKATHLDRRRLGGSRCFPDANVGVPDSQLALWELPLPAPTAWMCLK